MQQQIGAKELGSVHDVTPAFSARAARRRRLRAVIVEQDRVQFEGAVERLIGLLERLDGVDWSLVVVDNGRRQEQREASEQRVTSRLSFIGGDDVAREFSGYDRGVSIAIEPREQPDAWLFVSDAFLAHAEDILPLVDARAVELCVALDACVGWVDRAVEPVTLLETTYRDWLRSSFVFVPHVQLNKILPFAAELDEETWFNSEPDDPFSPIAPLSDELKRYLLERLTNGNGRSPQHEPHTVSESDESRFTRFRETASAILREHLLSMRIRAANLRCYDLRLIALLRTSLRADDARLLRDWEWSNWHRASQPSELCLSTLHHVDKLEFPASFEQGEPARLEITGWALSDPAADAVQLELGSAESVLLPLTIFRSDVRETYPQYGTECCGFSAIVPLSGLGVGRHDLALYVGRHAERVPIGFVLVLPRCKFQPTRLLIPEYFVESARTPIALEGKLSSSLPIERVELTIDGVTIEPPPRLIEQPREADRRYTIHVAAAVELDVSKAQHELELRFFSAGGPQRWLHRFIVRGARSLGCGIAQAMFGPYRTASSLVHLRIAGTLYDVRAGDTVVLERDGRVLMSRALSVEADFGIAWFDLEMDSTDVPPGIGQFALFVERSGRRLCAWQHDVLVPYDRPEITIDALDVEYPKTSMLAVLKAAGWVKNHFPIDCLAIEIDGVQRCLIALNTIRPDVARAYQSTLALTQGFEVELPLENVSPGEHLVQIVAFQQAGERAAIGRQILINPPAPGVFSLISEDLERFLQCELVRIYSAVSIRGIASVKLDDVVATLLIDERKVDVATLPRGDRVELCLAAVPKEGLHDVRLLVTSRDSMLYDSGPLRIEFAPIEPPAAAVAAVDVFLERFELKDRMISVPSSSAIVRELLDDASERPHSTALVLEQIGERLAHADPNPRARITRPAAPRDAQPLKVLFVSWEVPSSRHGGGLLMSKVLEHASERHEITLVHSHGHDELKDVDEVRRYCRRVVSVPRAWHRAYYQGDGTMPQAWYDEYSRRLRQIIEMEVFTGQYDIVNYEYAPLLPYIVDVGPRVLYDHEVGYTARLNTGFRSVKHGAAGRQLLKETLYAFHRSTVQIPSHFRHIIAITEDDAAALLEFQRDAKVYVQQAGVDYAHFAARPPNAQPPTDPTFVFVGNYRHTPNVDAVLLFADTVWPEFVRRTPKARFRIVGAHPPESILRLREMRGIEVAGFVDDIRTELHGATAFVAPIHTGAGMRLKVLEALAAGIPVIATELAMRGTRGEPGRHYLRAEGAAEFIEALRAVATSQERADVLGRAGQSLARDHDWQARVAEREAIWFDVIADYKSTPTTTDTERPA